MDKLQFIAKNKKAYFNYELSDRIEAGIVLKGNEVQSIRMGKINFIDSYTKIKNNEAWLINFHISQYPYAYYEQYDPERPRKLLLHRYEIKRILGKILEKNFNLIPLSIYFKKGKAKIELALAKGKKQYDKRYTIKKREQDREISRALKQKNIF